LKAWIERQLKKYNRGKVFVHFHPHAELRMIDRGADVDKIVETVRKGKVLERKSTAPNRIAFSFFFKEGFTYVVIVKLYPNSFQVRTVWKRKGRI